MTLASCWLKDINKANYYRTLDFKNQSQHPPLKKPTTVNLSFQPNRIHFFVLSENLSPMERNRVFSIDEGFLEVVQT